MNKFIIGFFVFLGLYTFHYLHLKKVEKNTALNILDSLRLMELEIIPDEEEDGDKMYLSPKKHARKIAIIDCEQLVYEKYRLWN